MQNKKGFTLVELIVVITILVILGTIAFISLQGYSKQARDTSRLSTMKNIEKLLELHYIKNESYPEVESDGKITITASGVTVGYQGYFGSDTSRILSMTEVPIDPKDKTKYVYSTNVNKTKFQLLGFMESSSNLALINKAYTNNNGYTDRQPKSLGDNIGIILNEDNSPVSEDLDIGNGNTNYKLIFNDDDIITGSGNILFSNIYNRNKYLINDKSNAALDESLIGYWDMETTSMSGSQVVLKDFSKYGNNANCYNSGVLLDCGTNGFGPQFLNGNGKIGNSMIFDGIDDSLQIKDFPELDKLTIIVKIKYNMVSGGGNQNIISYDGGSEGAYFLRIDSSNKESKKTSFFTYVGTSPELRVSTNVNSEKNGETYFLSGVYDGNYLKIYKDSLLYGNNSRGPINYSGSNGNLYIGKGDSSNENFLDGVIDEIRIYNRGLSEQEIKALYSYSN